MSEQQSFLWISGWSISADIWGPYYKKWPFANHYALSFDTCEHVEQILEKAVHTIQQIGGRVIIVGWSLGAMVALQLASQFPEQVSHLFLISGVAEFVNKEHNGVGWDKRVLRRMKKLLQIDAYNVIRLFDQKMFSTKEKKAGDLDRWNEAYRKNLPSLPSLQAGLDFLEQFSFDDQSYIQIPVFLLSGAEDEVCPTVSTLALAKQLSRSNCTILKESGHVCFWTQREQFQQWIKEGLSDEFA